MMVETVYSFYANSAAFFLFQCFRIYLHVNVCFLVCANSLYLTVIVWIKHSELNMKSAFLTQPEAYSCTCGLLIPWLLLNIKSVNRVPYLDVCAVGIHDLAKWHSGHISPELKCLTKYDRLLILRGRRRKSCHTWSKSLFIYTKEKRINFVGTGSSLKLHSHQKHCKNIVIVE